MRGYPCPMRISRLPGWLTHHPATYIGHGHPVGFTRSRVYSRIIKHKSRLFIFSPTFTGRRWGKGWFLRSVGADCQRTPVEGTYQRSGVGEETGEARRCSVYRRREMSHGQGNAGMQSNNFGGCCRDRRCSFVLSDLNCFIAAV